MRRMIPEKQQEVLKKLSEKNQFLQNVTISDIVNVDTFSLALDSDGISYFTISGSVEVNTSDLTGFRITGIPNGLKSAGEYPATNNLSTSGYVLATKIAEDTYDIQFNGGTAGRTIYFSVMLSQVYIEY